MRVTVVHSLFAIGLAAAASLSAGCEKQGCLRGDFDTCQVPSPCTELSFSCDDDRVDVRTVTDASELPGGLDALGAVGDIILENDQVQVVIEAINNPNFFSVSGGFIIDIATRGDDNDSVVHIEHITGFLPGDGFVYTDMKLITEGDGFRAVQVTGHLAGDPLQKVATRYELRACEPGVRIRTEFINGGDEEIVSAVADGFYWGDRATTPFTPNIGGGFTHPEFGLGGLNDVIREIPWMAAASNVLPAASYATVACNRDTIEGLQSAQVSVVGTPRRIIPSGEFDVYERFIGVANGLGAAPGVDLALELRKQLHGEDYVQLSGRVTVPGGSDAINRASIRVSAGDPNWLPGALRPVTMAVLDDGAFSVRVPANERYVLEVVSFGKVEATRAFSVGTSDLTLDALVVSDAAQVTLDVRVDGSSSEGQVFFRPADIATRESTAAYFNGHPVANKLCAPLLGGPWGESPACDRVLTNGGTTVDVPPGTYDIVATIGPFATLATQTVTLTAGTAQVVTLDIQTLPDLANGGLSADFHVHGSRSFDSNMPDTSRVLSFLTQRVDVIAATEHDTIWDFAEAMETLNVGDRVRLLTGLETTGHALFDYNPDVTYPQVVGHFNFWPLRMDETRPRKGAPYDELAEPGELYTRMAQAGLDDNGVIQMNHPWVAGATGRDFGFPFALGLKLTDPLPPFDDGTAAGVFVRTPPGARFANNDYHTQEVMNGTNNDSFRQYRAFWFYLLNQGILRAATANSDSHTLVDNVVGTPRTLVFSDTNKADFDPDVFNRAVREGRMIGTNGPMIRATVPGPGDTRIGPSIEPVTPAQRELHVEVHAAPWVPVDEIRIYANGVLAARITGGITQPDDELGTEGTKRFESTFDLNELLPDDRIDSWIVVEAGARLAAAVDLDCDGVPDTTDNNGDGVADALDVDRNADGQVDDDDLDVNGDGTVDGADEVERCSGPTGPIQDAPAPDRAGAGYLFEVVTPGGFPLAFTNPLVLNLDGRAGFEAPGLVGGTP